HGFDRGVVVAVLVTSPHPPCGGNGGGLGRAHEFESRIAMGGGGQGPGGYQMGAHQGRADRSDPTGAWQDAGVSSLWCFQCGAEYEPGVETCVECGVGLVTEAPLAPEDVGTSDEEQLAYELHDWSFESRRMLDQLLTGAGLAHSWQ